MAATPSGMLLPAGDCRVPAQSSQVGCGTAGSGRVDMEREVADANRPRRRSTARLGATRPLLHRFWIEKARKTFG